MTAGPAVCVGVSCPHSQHVQCSAWVCARSRQRAPWLYLVHACCRYTRSRRTPSPCTCLGARASRQHGASSVWGRQCCRVPGGCPGAEGSFRERVLERGALPASGSPLPCQTPEAVTSAPGKLAPAPTTDKQRPSSLLSLEPQRAGEGCSQGGSLSVCLTILGTAPGVQGALRVCARAASQGCSGR